MSGLLVGAAISRPPLPGFPPARHCEERSDAAIRPFLSRLAAGRSGFPRQCAHWLGMTWKWTSEEKLTHSLWLQKKNTTFPPAFR